MNHPFNGREELTGMKADLNEEEEIFKSNETFGRYPGERL
jgi:hypothetical protein